MQLKKRELKERIYQPRTVDRYSTYPSQGLTPGKLASILKQADAGDVYQQMELFEEMEEKDTHLFSQLQTRKLALQGLDWEVQPGDDKRSSKKAAEFCQEVLENLPSWDESVLDILDALGKGFSVSEILWDLSEREWAITDLRWIHPKKITFWDSFVPKVVTDENWQGEDIPAWKAVYYRFKARSGFDTRSGLLRTCAWMYLFKNYAVKDWVAFAEVYGMPLRVGKYPPGSSDEAKNTLLDALRNLGSDAAAAIPEGMMIDFVDSPDKASSSSIFQDLADFCDRQMSKAVVGQVLTSDTGEGGGGSYALGKEHGNVRQDILEADCKAFQRLVTRQILRPLALFNFGDKVALPAYKLHYEPPEDLTGTADLYKKLIVDMGYPVSQEHVEERFGVPKAKEGETLMTPPQSGGLPGGMGFNTGLAKDNAADSGEQRETSDDMPDDDKAVYEKIEADIGNLTEKALEDAAPAVEKMVSPVESLVSGAADLEALLKTLRTVELDIDGVAEDMARMFAGGELKGRDAVFEETDFMQRREGAEGEEEPVSAATGRREKRDTRYEIRLGKDAEYGSLPWSEVIEYFRNKLNIPTARWDELWEEQHSKAFTVAGAMKEDLLADLRSAVDKAISEGTTLKEFQGDFQNIVEQHGWKYKGSCGWRTRLIYETNLSTAYSAGRYRAQTDPAVKAVRPYLRYVPSSSANPRESHMQWYNLVLPADHPFWDTHYPPNGWGCKCGVVSVSGRELARLQKRFEGTANEVKMDAPGIDYYEHKNKKTGETKKVPQGIDPGWSYNPGKRAA